MLWWRQPPLPQEHVESEQLTRQSAWNSNLLWDGSSEFILQSKPSALAALLRTAAATAAAAPPALLPPAFRPYSVAVGASISKSVRSRGYKIQSRCQMYMSR